MGAMLIICLLFCCVILAVAQDERCECGIFNFVPPNYNKPLGYLADASTKRSCYAEAPFPDHCDKYCHDAGVAFKENDGLAKPLPRIPGHIPAGQVFCTRLIEDGVRTPIYNEDLYAYSRLPNCTATNSRGNKWSFIPMWESEKFLVVCCDVYGNWTRCENPNLNSIDILE